MRSEEKDTVCMKDIVQKSMKPGNVCMDACAGTFSVVRACLFLPKYRTVIRCEVDVSGVTKKMLF